MGFPDKLTVAGSSALGPTGKHDAHHRVTNGAAWERHGQSRATDVRGEGAIMPTVDTALWSPAFL